MQIRHKWISYTSWALMIAVSAVTLLLTLRGRTGNPTETDLGLSEWKENGPFELSHERGSYALTFSLLENRSYTFSPYLAAFVSPDLAITHDYFVSLFPPGLSYLVMPGYLLGREYGLAQVGGFAIVALFALVNTNLIYRIARALGVSSPAAGIAGIAFLLATPALTYAVSMYQHHATTLFLLLSTLTLLGKTSWGKLAWLWFLTASAIVVDTPNAIIFIPLALAGLGRIAEVKQEGNNQIVNLKLIYLTALVSVIIPAAVLLNFNKRSYDNPWQLGGAVRRATEVKLEVDPVTGQPTAKSEKLEIISGDNKNVIAYFKTRNMMKGLYTLFLSVDRGTIFFAPTLFLGLLGVAAAVRKNRQIATVMLTTVAFIIILYSTWGDPYGGWAFGSRYLIPAYAMFAPFLAVALNRHIRSYGFVILFLVPFVYSVGVNMAGALTSSAIPVDGNYLTSFATLADNRSKSLLYNEIGYKYMTANGYAITLGGLVTVYTLLQLSWLIMLKGEDRT